MKDKIDKDVEDYVILGACNPALAYEVLSSELEIGALLPCNVILYEDDGQVVVSAMDPEAVLALVSSPEVKEIADEVRGRLERALGKVARPGD
jgi:uncharacterized protein (DUF302 family)